MGNSYYEIPAEVKDLDDLAEHLDLRFDEFNALKGLFGYAMLRKTGESRHKGTDATRDLDKFTHYSKRVSNRVG